MLDSKLPLVSIGIPSFNTAKFIIATLDSIKNQSYPNIEIIIVDDCSRDNSVELIEAWLLTCPIKYTFIRNEVNLGLTRTCNILLNNARGRYFAVLGADDVYAADKLGVQVALLEEKGPGAALVYSDISLMDEHGKILEGSFFSRFYPDLGKPQGKVFVALTQHNFIPAISILGRTNCFLEVGGYDEKLAFEDWDMWLKLALKFEFFFSDYVSGIYRIHSASMSHNKSVSFHESALIIYKKYLGLDPEADPFLLKGIRIQEQAILKIASQTWLDRMAFKLIRSLRTWKATLRKYISN